MLSRSAVRSVRAASEIATGGRVVAVIDVVVDTCRRRFGSFQQAQETRPRLAGGRRRDGASFAKGVTTGGAMDGRFGIFARVAHDPRFRGSGVEISATTSSIFVRRRRNRGANERDHE